MLAFLFPGQGSQAVGMGADLLEASPVCKETFREADAALGFDLTKICFEGPADRLQLTAIAQPAILTVSIAAFRYLLERGIRPHVVAGHSLGEYSALVAAGSLAFRDAVVLVHKRGTYMQDAVPVGVGAMAALMGLDRDAVDSLCREAADGQVLAPANLNAPDQIVISGHAEAVDRAISRARDHGARRAVKLQVSAPFHCPLMEPAARRLAEDLSATSFGDLEVPLVSNVTAGPIREGDAAREALTRQVTGAVRWEESVRAMAAMGVDRALEVGPGKVLAGLVKRTSGEIDCLPAGTSETLRTITEAGS